MLRAFTSVLWLIAALALGFESVAQPCEIASKMDLSSPHEMHSEMPCHDDMAPANDTSDEMP